MQTATVTSAVVEDDERGYDLLLERIQERFRKLTDDGKRPLFTVDGDGAVLFDIYLRGLPEANRQYHTCNCCRRFFEQFGSLVVVNADGSTESAIWDPELAPDYYRKAVESVAKVVKKSPITGVFKSSEFMWGTPSSEKSAKHGGHGAWTHYHVKPPRAAVHASRVQTAYQASAEKLEDYRTVSRALGEYSEEMLASAVRLLKSDALYRSEKVLGGAEWLLKLKQDQAAAGRGERRKNVAWAAVASAPAGFCHPRSSMIGTLLDDLAAGKDFDDVARSFKAKMHPLSYQRPQAAPTAGVIAQAEKLFEQLNLASALRRRFAKVEEIDAFWRPVKEEEKPAGGVFGHLSPKAPKPAAMELPGVTMTWEKFQRTVLPEAKRIQMRVPTHGNFTALVTAADPEAEKLFRWGHHFSQYVYHGGSSARQWSLAGGEMAELTAICFRTENWYGKATPGSPSGVTFVIEGCRETRNSGLAIFPETMRSELHGVRAVIEAHSASGRIEGMADASACGVNCGGASFGVTLRVFSADGPRNYTIDRQD